MFNALVALSISVHVSRGCQRVQLTRTLRITSRSTIIASTQLTVGDQCSLSAGLTNFSYSHYRRNGFVPDVTPKRKIQSSVLKYTVSSRGTRRVHASRGMMGNQGKMPAGSPVSCW